MLKKSEKNKGITLIALVITVIVMLILAGVAISALTGTNGLLSQTIGAGKTYNEAAKNEADKVQGLLNELNNYTSGGNTPPVDSNPVVYPKLNEGIKADQNQTFDGRANSTYSNPIVPKGFAPINENGAMWGNETGYQQGLVIRDENGNEFVWVPVDGTNVKFTRYNDFSSWIEKDPSGYIETIPTEITTSVAKNGGFYIGRYEAGNESNKLVTKKGATVWNYISWNDAEPKARAMYNDSNTYGAKSTLIYGTQWDTTLKFISSYGGDTTYAIDSTGKGNYAGTSGGDTTTDTPAIAGALEAFRQKNIYDMAGNIHEWTMEVYDTSYRFLIGGNYTVSGSNFPASGRNYNTPDYRNNDVGFRIAIYI